MRTSANDSQSRLPHSVPKNKLADVKLLPVCAIVLLLGLDCMQAQTRSDSPASGGLDPLTRDSGVSNKTLITKSSGPITEVATLRMIAADFYRWRNENFPVNSSNQGLHTWDDRL